MLTKHSSSVMSCSCEIAYQDGFCTASKSKVVYIAYTPGWSEHPGNQRILCQKGSMEWWEEGVQEAGVQEAGVREAGVREAGVREAGVG